MKNATVCAALAVALVLVPGWRAASAQVPRLNPSDCRALALIAGTFAEVRDLGADREKYRALLRRMNESVNAEAMVLIMGELDLVYDAWPSPQQAFSDALRRCAAEIERQGGDGGSGAGRGTQL